MIGEIFNTHSFINLQEHITVRNPQVKDFLEKSGQYTFADYRPGSYTSLQYQVRRKLKTAAKAWKMRMQTNNFNFGPLIEKIIELDNNPILYKAMLGEPWLKGNSVPPSPAAARWREIFNTTRN
jgi:N12 class adenine-specific DNA methylase